MELTRHRLGYLLLLVLLLAACSAGSSAGDGSGDPRTIEVRMSDALRYEPADFAVTAGETVQFTVINDGQSTHEFLIGDEAAQAEFEDEMAGGGMHHDTDAGVSVEPGQTETFEYTFSEIGTLLAGCHEPGHYDGGMVANIIVSD